MKDIQKIKKRDYVRCGSAGIRRVTEVIKSPTDLKVKKVKDEDNLLIDVKYINDFDSNILNLIKEGDYVNGQLMTSEYFVNGIPYRDSYKRYDGLTKLKVNEIRDILTKEQYETKSYKLK